MIIEKINGWIVIRDVVNGYWVTKKYMYYTLKEAKQLFRKQYYGQM